MPMDCPHCGSEKDGRVETTKAHRCVIVRYRKCALCGRKWATIETVFTSRARITPSEHLGVDEIIKHKDTNRGLAAFLRKALKR